MVRFTILATAAVLTFGSAALAANSDQAQGDAAPTLASKQHTGDGDTGYGDRAPELFGKADVTKQRTGDGDTGYGDRAPELFGNARRGATTTR
ncbi:MAG: hypothetical protein BGO51_11450 [Rhodospirillales bacterium 69-11]|nr:hypothetical protein [Rhodospirillales bacterium]OJW29636.1 MAG: hypothetical protein BGO51_11450 [Rhodospirillales bacterium 69-11]